MSEKITINLQESSNARNFKGNSIINKAQFDKLTQLIHKRVLRLEEMKISTTDSALDTITIYGSRGSGKTSFLRSIAEEYREVEEVEVIDIIDPTMIEEKGHIFLTIISQIDEKVEACFNAFYKPEQQTSQTCMRQGWRTALLNLSAGLPSLDGIGGAMDDWQDPEFIMDRGLRSVKSAVSLSKNFNKLVDMALKILNKKVFLLMLDDIDIDFSKGWPLLETIRKYLTTPQIITIVSGDQQLFSKAIRKKQWGNFGKALLKNEGEVLNRMQSYDELVTEMKSQYMLKVLKPQYRIKLRTLYEIVEGGQGVDIQAPGAAVSEDISKYYDKILENFGIRNPYQRNVYKNFIMTLPLRTQIQFLIKYPISETSTDNNFVDSISEVFSSDFHQNDVDVDLALNMPQYMNAIALKMLVNNHILDEAYQLQPITTDKDINSSLLGMSMLLSNYFKKYPYLIFDYLVRIGYIRNLTGLLDADDDSNSNSNKTSEVRYRQLGIETLIKHASLLMDKNLHDTMCYTTSFMRAFLNVKLWKENFRPYAGSVCTYGLAESAKKTVDKHKLDEEFVDGSLAQLIAYIPASKTQFSRKQSTITTYSIYVLLGAIAEIMKMHTIDKGKIGTIIYELSQIKAYAAPFEISNTNSNISPEEEELEMLYQGSEDANNILPLLSEWIEKEADIVVSPHILGKISTRLFASIQSIETRKIEKVGEMMHRYIIAFMNAVLVEDARENILNTTLNNNNPISKDDIFIDNLSKLNSLNKTNIGFSKWMLSCPLLLIYLNNTNDKLNENLGGFIGKSGWVKGNTIYEALNKVDIRLNDVESDKPKFSGAIENIPLMINILSPTLRFQDFKEMDISVFKEKYGNLFSGSISLKSFNSLKENIESKNRQW